MKGAAEIDLYLGIRTGEAPTAQGGGPLMEDI